MTDELAAWFGQVLDWDQSAAEACAEVYPSPWDLSDRGYVAYVTADAPRFWRVAELEQYDGDDGWLGDRLQHVALHHPAAVLADIAAKRAVLARYIEATEAETSIRATYDGDTSPRAQVERAGYTQAASGLRHVVMDLATGYAGRDGYQEVWRP